MSEAKTLYQQLGEGPGIASVVDRLYELIIYEDIRSCFGATLPRRLRREQ